MFDQKKQVGDDQSLLESGIVDSTGILELIGFLEDTYKVKFQDEELIGENFDTLGKLTSFLMTKIMDAGATKNASA